MRPQIDGEHFNMTVNITSVHTQTNSVPGVPATNDKANGGVFAETFSQASQGQSFPKTNASTLKNQSVNNAVNKTDSVGETPALGHADAELEHSGSANELTASVDDLSQSETRANDQASAVDNKASADDKDGQPVAVAWADSAFAVPNSPPKLHGTEFDSKPAATDSRALDANNRISVALNAQPNAEHASQAVTAIETETETETEGETAKRQGGSALPPEFVATKVQTATAAEQAAAKASQAVPLNGADVRTTDPVNSTHVVAAQPEVNVQAQAIAQNTKAEQAAKAEQGDRTANLTPGAAARAPEWLAQIEHGKRWSQATNALGAKIGADSGVRDASQPTDAVNSLSAQVITSAQVLTIDSADTTAEILAAGPASNGQEASGLLLNREQTLLAATPERAAMLDKALTLHGSAEQNAKQLAQQAQVVVSQNLQEADIKLNPSEFGAMRIQIRIEQGEVQVQFVVSHPQARELLEQAMPRLREMLQQQGMNLQQGQQQASQQQSGQQSGQNQANASLLAQGFGQSGAGQGESAQQPADQSASQAEQEHQWRSYSASGDEIQEQALENRPRALYGIDGAKIDFFA